jgi:hypothetical protein
MSVCFQATYGHAWSGSFEVRLRGGELVEIGRFQGKGEAITGRRIRRVEFELSSGWRRQQ